MKVTTNRKKEFTPIDVTFTIELQKELNLLLAIFSASDSSLIKFAEQHRGAISGGFGITNSYEIYSTLNDLTE